MEKPLSQIQIFLLFTGQSRRVEKIKKKSCIPQYIGNDGNKNPIYWVNSVHFNFDFWHYYWLICLS
jgi:hypothetical protein